MIVSRERHMNEYKMLILTVVWKSLKRCFSQTGAVCNAILKINTNDFTSVCSFVHCCASM